MIKYEPGTWGIAFAFQCKGSVFPKSVLIAGPAAVICAVLHSVIRHTSKLLDDDMEYAGVATNVMGGFTVILGFLIVFRSQQAYSRWWEGGTLLQQIRGEWFNAYSSLLAFCNAAPEKATDVQRFRHMLVRLFSMLYAAALEQATTMQHASFDTIDLSGFEPESLHALKTAHDRCEVVLQWIQREMVVNSASKVILIEPPILSRVYNQLGNGIVMLSNARKITEFPIPFPLAQMVAFMLACHWVLTLFFCVVYVPDVWNSCVICFIVIFSFWSINYISLELEMPFGDDPNDLPLEDMQRDFNASLAELLRPKFITPPAFDYLGDQHDKLMVSATGLDVHIDNVLLASLNHEDIDRLNRIALLETATTAEISRDDRKAAKLKKQHSEKRDSRPSPSPSPPWSPPDSPKNKLMAPELGPGQAPANQLRTDSGPKASGRERSEPSSNPSTKPTTTEALVPGSTGKTGVGDASETKPRPWSPPGVVENSPPPQAQVSETSVQQFSQSTERSDANDRPR